MLAAGGSLPAVRRIGKAVLAPTVTEMNSPPPMRSDQAAYVPVPGSDLTSGIVRLRRWRLDDVGCIEATTADPHLSAGTTLPAEFTIADGEGFIRRQWWRVPNGEGLSLAIARADTDVAVGSIVSMLRPQPGVTGVGYWVVPSARGNGYAGAAVRLLADWTVSVGGFARMEAWIQPSNSASQRVVERAGFELEGILRSYLPLGTARQDMQVWSRVRSPA